jgi:hypothetical protein
MEILINSPTLMLEGHYFENNLLKSKLVLGGLNFYHASPIGKYQVKHLAHLLGLPHLPILLG